MLGDKEDEIEETWIELKSTLAKSKSKRDELPSKKFNTWSVQSTKAKTSSEYHKQFTLDRIARINGGALKAYIKENGKYVELGNIQWRFQDFKVDYSSSSRVDYGLRLGSNNSGICAQMKMPAGNLARYAEEYRDGLDEAACGSSTAEAAHTNVALELLDLLKSHYQGKITPEMVDEITPFLISD